MIKSPMTSILYVTHDSQNVWPPRKEKNAKEITGTQNTDPHILSLGIGKIQKTLQPVSATFAF